MSSQTGCSVSSKTSRAATVPPMYSGVVAVTNTARRNPCRPSPMEIFLSTIAWSMMENGPVPRNVRVAPA